MDSSVYVQADASAQPGQTTPPPGANNASDGTERDAAPPLILTIPTSDVPCAGAPCNTLSNVCCSAWSKTTGFGGEESCIPRDACYMKFRQNGDTQRAVTRECDGKEDCSAGQVCCIYADGRPLYENPLDPTNLIGPGGSTICAEASDCTYNNRGTFVAAGIPLGEFECNDDSDCGDRAGSTCQPELSDSHSTGAGAQARPEVSVCR